MIAFETSLNNELLAVAGDEELSVLTMMLDIVPPYAGTHGTPSVPNSCSLTFSLEGTTENDSKDWVCTRTLSLNDSVRVKIAESAQASAPIVRDDEATMDRWNVVQPKDMVVFEVYKNGDSLCRAGHAELSTLSLHIVALGHLGKKSLGTTPQQRGESEAGYEVELLVSGITKSESGVRSRVQWIKGMKLVVGDEILFKISDSEAADPPISSKQLTS